MRGTMKLLIDLREVFLSLGILLFVISYFKDNFSFYGLSFLGGLFVVIFAAFLYLINFFDRFP